jgi:hypothetical protein
MDELYQRIEIFGCLSNLPFKLTHMLQIAITEDVKSLLWDTFKVDKVFL